MTGDRLIIMTYGQFTPEELKTYCPTVVLVDEKPGGGSGAMNDLLTRV